MNVTGGTADVTTFFMMRLAATGVHATGLTIANFSMQYTRTGDTPAAHAHPTALAAANTAHADNYGIEVDATNSPGLYRFDWPDAAFAAGVRQVALYVSCATAFSEAQVVDIDPPVDVTKWAGTAPHARATEGIPVVTVHDVANDAITAAAIANGAIDAATFAAGAIDAAAIANGAIDNATFAADVGSTAYATNIIALAADKAVVNAALGTAAELAKVPKSDSNVSWNATALAAIQAEANDALVANNLDHLALTATAAADMTTEVADNTILSRILGNGDTSTFVPSTDGLHAAGVDLDTSLLDTGTTIPNTLIAMSGAGFAATDSLVAIKAAILVVDDFVDTEVASILAAVDTEVADIKAKTDNLPQGIKRNTALADFEFVMVDATTKVPTAALTPAGARSIDGGAFAACTNTATIAEVGNGVYAIDLAAADLNGTMITLRFTAAGADDTLVHIKTNA
jgi:hypothetical protein